MADPSGFLPQWLAAALPMDNQFFTGGLSLAVMGAAARYGTVPFQLIRGAARRRLWMSLEVNNRDPAYPWVMRWLLENSARTQHLSVSTRTSAAYAESPKNSANSFFKFEPSVGRHFIWHGWRLITVNRERAERQHSNDGVPWETVTLTVLGNDPQFFAGLLTEAKALEVKGKENKTTIYKNWGVNWRPFGPPREKRAIDSVILADGLSEEIYNDVIEFLETEKWYRTRGIPYRRGYLFHGPPGSGKTSFITALAGEIAYDIASFSLMDPGLTDDSLAHAMSDIPPQTLVLLEDIDAAFGNGDTNITFSGLLNTLDGVSASEERICFMTTNHIELLDPALMRPGRIDKVYHLGDATDNQAHRLFMKFYTHTTQESELSPSDGLELDVQDIDHLSQEWTRSISELKIRPSMAELQGHLLRFKEDPESAVNKVVSELLPAVETARNAAASGLARGGHSGSRRRLPVGRRLSAADIDNMTFQPQPNW
eukprot:CAMPEP_0167746918 /NCGR_PEP_ID=MMETSP0110_2-20121227/3981_1 /TAXON_ID=629695 /ORGANISM="Gymnochlora sp., Strain CCMP2014" /LENGTH=483 /DNA_ID=CAMNT_0007631739 /DNA_START=44 /DNA_END=1492 /DNA_ORIENTATION=+